MTNTVRKFTKGNYVKAVQDLARQTLDKLTAYQTQNSAKQ